MCTRVAEVSWPELSVAVDWGTYRSLCRRLFPLLCIAKAITRQQDTTAGPARRLLIACCVQGAPCTPTKAIAGLQQHTGEGSPEDAGTSAGLGKIPPATLVWHEVTCDILDRASLKSKRVRALRRLTLPILRCSAVHGPIAAIAALIQQSPRQSAHQLTQICIAWAPSG